MTFYSLPRDLTAISELIPLSISLLKLSFWNENFHTVVTFFNSSLNLQIEVYG